jgi:hypothetical protein
MKETQRPSLFHEMYGRYFSIVSELLAKAQKAPITSQAMISVCESAGYAETPLALPEILTESTAKKDKIPPLFFPKDGAFSTSVAPRDRSLSYIERRWLLTILRDPKMRLFMDDDKIDDALKTLTAPPYEKTEAFFEHGDYSHIDANHDPDDYADEAYRGIFRTVLQALKEKRGLEIEYRGYSGQRQRRLALPLKIEYSLRYDLFLLIFSTHLQDRHVAMPIRIRRIQRAEITNTPVPSAAITPKIREALLSIGFESDALERAHAQLANYKVEDTLVENERGKKITLRVSYPEYSEDSLLESLLSFGPEIEVTAPTALVEKIRRMVSFQ